MTTCYACTKGFSLFNSEKSCEECRLSFCKGCLPRNVHLDSLGREGKVCSSCYKKLTGKGGKRSPPSALQRRLDLSSAPNPTATAIIYKESASNSKMARLRRGLSLEDQQIVNRLQKLHEERVSLTKKNKEESPAPKEDEIEARLARLRNKEVIVANAALPTADKRTPIQKEEDLLSQAKDMIRIEGLAPDPDAEISSRLAKLKGGMEGRSKSLDVKGFMAESSLSPEENMDITPDNMEEMAKKLQNEASEGLKDLQKDKELSQKMKDIKLDPQGEVDDSETSAVLQQILDEAAIEEKLGQVGPLPTFEEDPISISVKYSSRQVQKQLGRSVQAEECPWCVICNEDASLRCFDCESDLYCNRCFKECHEEFDDAEHKTERFPPPGRKQ